MTSTPAQVKKRLKNLYKELGTWDKVALAAGLSKGCAYRIVKRKYIPKRKDIRLILDLPCEELSPVCPLHGVVHVGRCPRPHKPRQPWLSEEEIQERLDYLDRMFG